MEKQKHAKERMKHEKIAIGMALLGIICLVVSVIPSGYIACTGILQGIGTGLFTGVAILTVGGTKSYEINDKIESIDILNKYRECIGAISEIQINIDSEKLTVNGIDYPIVMISYVPGQLKLFFDNYCDNKEFESIASGPLLELHREFKKCYYEEVRKLCDDFGKCFKNHKELLTYAREIQIVHNYFCEEIFESDIDDIIAKLILKYKKEVSKLKHSRI